MADIIATLLEEGFDESDSASYASLSISPGSNKILLIGFTSRRNTSVPIPVPTGLGLSFVQVESEIQNAPGSLSRITVFRTNTGVSPGSGVITFTLSNTQLRGTWSIFELDEVDLGGVDGADAVVQFAKNTGTPVTSITATLAAFSDVLNATIGFLLGDNPSIQGPYSPGSGFSFLVNQLTGSQFNSQAVEFKTGNDTSVDASANASGGMAIIGIELKNATQTPAPPTPAPVVGSGRPSFISGNLIT